MRKLLLVFAILVTKVGIGQTNAIKLDGVDDQIVTSAAITNIRGNADFTIEAWIKTAGANVAIMVCSNGNSAWDVGEKAWYLTSTGVINLVGRNNGFIYGSVAVNDNLWHHVAVVWDYISGATNNGVGKMYVDGVERTGTSTTSLYNGTQADVGVFRFGIPNYGVADEVPTNWYNGSLDEIRVWNVARTAAQISASYSSQISPTSTGLVAYYQFNQGTAGGSNTGLTNVPDAKGTYPATLTNFALTGTNSNYVTQATSLLPVVWQSFSAERNGEKVLLNWSTASEENTKDFIIQRSTDGQKWTDLQTRPAAGNSHTPRFYSFDDLAPLTGTVNYYRIAQRDLDLSVRYSQITKVLVVGDRSLNILGNPVTGDMLSLQWNGVTSEVARLFDVQGRMMKQQQLVKGKNQLNVGQLPKGTYLLKAGTYQGQIMIQ